MEGILEQILEELKGINRRFESMAEVQPPIAAKPSVAAKPAAVTKPAVEVSLKDAAKQLGLTESYLRYLVNHKKVSYNKVGRKIMLDHDAMAELSKMEKRKYNRKKIRDSAEEKQEAAT